MFFHFSSTVYLYHSLPQQYTILYAVFDNILSFSSPGLFDIGVMYFTTAYVIKPEMSVLFLLQGIWLSFKQRKRVRSKSLYNFPIYLLVFLSLLCRSRPPCGIIFFQFEGLIPLHSFHICFIWMCSWQIDHFHIWDFISCLGRAGNQFSVGWIFPLQFYGHIIVI